MESEKVQTAAKLRVPRSSRSNKSSVVHSRKKRLPEKIFLIAFAIGVLRAILGISAMNVEPLKILTYTSIALFIVKIMLTKYRPREIPVMVALVVFSIIVYIRSHDNAIMLFVLTLIAAKKVPPSKILRVTLCTIVPTSLVIIVCSLTGLIGYKDFKIMRSYVWIHRYGLGFEHPNMLHAVFMIAAGLFIYFVFRKNLFPSLICIGVLNIGLYILTRSRTGLLTVFCMIAIATLYALPRFRKWTMRLSVPLFVFIVVFQLFLTIFYQKSSPLMEYINGLLMGRAMQAQYYLLHYHVSMFGTYIPDLTRTTFHYYLDFGYSRLLINFGWLTLLLYVFANVHTLLIYKSRRKPEYMLLIMTFAIAGFTENYIYYCYINITLMFFSVLLFGGSLYRSRLIDVLVLALQKIPGYKQTRHILHKCLRPWLEY